MNKQLERDLQCSIQSLKASQLANVLAYYEKISDTRCQKTISKKGMSYECQIHFKGQNTKGYGRNEQQSLSNATKNLLSVLVGKNIDMDKITKSLKYKNGLQSGQNKDINKKEAKSRYKYLSSEKQTSFVIDDISMIQANSRLDIFGSHQNQFDLVKKLQSKENCDCIYFQMHQYQHNQIKHLQARVNLLTEQNTLLKKMVLCGPGNKDISSLASRKSEDTQKQNSSYQFNSCSNFG